MALTGNQICTSIITGGLGCLPACESIITAQFGLGGLCTVTVEIQDGGGGSYPLAPGEIANLYQPVDYPSVPKTSDGVEYYVPNDSLKSKHVVKVTVEFKGRKTEREFLVNEKRAHMMVKAANFVNKTHERINVVASNIRRVVNHSVKVLNFRKKR